MLVSLRRLLCCVLGVVACLGATPVWAVETTDVLDAFDDDNKDPYDVNLRLRYAQDRRTSTVAREWRCLANDQVGAQVCPGGSGIELVKELQYERIRHTLFVDARVGLYKDTELMISLPFVLRDGWTHKFANGVSRANSTLYPQDDTAAVLAAPYESNQRAGFGDMVMGVRWAPYNWFRDSWAPTWVFGFDWTLPTGEVMTAENDGVGYGLHELKLHSTISRRSLGVIEPFFGLHGTLRVGADKGLFVSQGSTQTRSSPGAVIGTRFGSTFLPWEDIAADERVEIELGFSMDYFFEGREYTEIWEALGSPDNPCQADQGCTNLLHSRSAVDPATGRPRSTNGITDVEGYGRFAGWAAVHYQPIKHFQGSVSFNYGAETPHFITFGDYGRNLDGQKGVEQSNSVNQNEYSPTFLPELDTPGRRLRVQSIANWTLMVSVSGKL
jgi:hypothetical protein